MKKTLISTSILLTLTLGAVGLAQASTEAQKQAAIDKGLAYLAGQQAADGSWCESGYCASDTASVLLAMIEQKYKTLGWNGANYDAAVTNGLQYLMETAATTPTNNSKNIGTGGAPIMVASDGNGNSQGLIWGSNEATYVTGLVLPALARATAGIVAPSTVVTSANAATNGRTYQQIIQDAADSFVSGQTTQLDAWTPGWRGGWRYTPSTGQSDGSTAQWGAIGLSFAQNVPGVVVPTFVKDELKYWIDYIQNPSDPGLKGGSGYTANWELVNESKTGGLLVEMAFTGYNGIGGPTDTGGASNTAGAVAFLNDRWPNGPNSWDGNFGQPYAMWSVYKGLESTIGLTGGQITNFLYTGSGQVKDNPTDSWNWWEDYCQWLTDNQQSAGPGKGYWPAYYYWPTDLATAWGINILNATSVGIPPENPVPEPGTLLLFGAGLLGLTRFARRRKN